MCIQSELVGLQSGRFQALSEIAHLAELGSKALTQPNPLAKLLGRDAFQLVGILDHLQVQLSGVLIARGVSQGLFDAFVDVVFVHFRVVG